MTYQPSVRATSTPTFTWPSVPGAVFYQFFLTQDRRSPQPNIILTPAQAADDGTSCTYTPSAPTFPIPLQRGHYANWWLEASMPDGSVRSAGTLQFWVANIAGATNDYNVDNINTWDAKGCMFYGTSDFYGQARRVIDFSMTYTNGVLDQSSIGYYAFPENQYATVDISDIIPPGVDCRALKISMELILSGTNGGPYYYDLMAFGFRRHGATALNIPNVGLRYTVGARTPIEVTVPVNQNKLDFLWSHVGSGIDVAATDHSVITGRAINGVPVGYYA